MEVLWLYQGLKEIGIGCQVVIINILAEKRAQYSSFLRKVKKKFYFNKTVKINKHLLGERLLAVI
jgi:hypothetical protein